jgi:hypothetical protein
MNYKLALEHLGLKENIDFVITESSFEMLPKTQIVEISPQVLDEEGNILQEAVTEEQQYVPAAPSEETLQVAHEEVQLKLSDLALLIEEYLADKSELRDPENDELNISEGRIVRWGFANIPQPTRGELVALIPIVELKQSKNSTLEGRINAGKAAREACEKCLDLVAGVNLERSLTAEQITQMQTTFSSIQSALMTSRPSSAKALISAIVPDEVIVTAEMKEILLEILAEY